MLPVTVVTAPSERGHQLQSSWPTEGQRRGGPPLRSPCRRAELSRMENATPDPWFEALDPKKRPAYVPEVFAELDPVPGITLAFVGVGRCVDGVRQP